MEDITKNKVNKLVKKVKRGNKNALVDLILIKKDDIYKLAFVYMESEDEAMNIIQDTILIVYENILSLRDNEKFYSWFKTILVNKCKDRLREGRRLVYVEDIDQVSGDRSYIQESNLEVKDLISRLKPPYREVIELRYILEYDYKIIGEVLNIPIGTVKSRLNKAKLLLKKEIERGV